MGRTELSGKELSRVEVMGRVKARSLRLDEAAEMLGLSYRQSKRIWARYREGGAKALQHGNCGHLSRKLCWRDSCRCLETGLKHGIELVKHTSDIASHALPLTLLEGRDGEAELKL